MRFSLFVIVIASSSLLAVPPAWAGLCLDGTDHFVAELEKVSAGRAKLEDTEVYCLHVSPISENNSKWAGPRAARSLASVHDEKLDARIVKACVPILDGTDATLRRTCAAILATRGIRQAGKYTTYELEPVFSKTGFTPTQLASLGGPEAGERIRKRFGQETHCRIPPGTYEPVCIEITAAQRKHNRFKRAQYRSYKFHQLNALWHAGCAADVSFLEEVAASDGDPDVRKRAQKVLTRLAGK